MSAIPRRFVIAEPPRGTAWIEEILRRAYRTPERLPAVLERLIERLSQTR